MMPDNRCPRLTAYLAALPRGLESHPEAEVKGSILRSGIEGHELPAAYLAELPEPVRDALLTPPLPGSFMSETVGVAAYLAIGDYFYPEDRAFLNWALSSNRKLFSGAMYRTVMSVTTPGLIARGAAARWQFFHRGSSMKSRVGIRECSLEIDFPRHLYPPLYVDALGTAIRAAAELSKARDLRLETAEMGPDRAVFQLNWRE
jgi:hypothetical protein